MRKVYATIATIAIHKMRLSQKRLRLRFAIGLWHDSAMPLLICLAALAIDGDTLACADGTRLRVAGIEANELHQPGCHLPACPAMSGVEARERMQAIVSGKTLTYQPVGKTWNRISARVTLPDGRDLACQAIRDGVAVRWEKFDLAGRLKGC